MRSEQALSRTRFICALLFTAFALTRPVLSPAQLINDGDTATLSNFSQALGTFSVGTNDSFTLLILSDNTSLSSFGYSGNPKYAYVGQNATSSSNEVRIASPSARWSPYVLHVGYHGSGNRVMLSNGGRMVSDDTRVGWTGSSNNSVTITGAGSSWTNIERFMLGDFGGGGNSLEISDGGRFVGYYTDLGESSSGNHTLVTGADSLLLSSSHFSVGWLGSSNQLIVSDGGQALSYSFYVGGSSGSDNQAIVTGAGSVIYANKAGTLYVGNGSGGRNRILVENGGTAISYNAQIGGGNTNSQNNEVCVTGPGSLWTNTWNLQLGGLGSRNRLIVTNGGTMVNGRDIYFGVTTNSLDNRLIVDGGTLRVTNAAGASTLNPRRGTNELNAGLVEASNLIVTNSTGAFDLNGGTFAARNIIYNNGSLFRVGDGSKLATLKLVGNGSNYFPNGLSVSAAGTLTGAGVVSGPLTLAANGSLSPGDPVGAITLSTTPVLQGTVVMDLTKNGGTLANDQISVAAPLTYGGSLIVTHLGPTPLAVGDRFTLFNATSFAGLFSSVTLPPVPTGLAWNDRLLVDGSIEVVVPQLAIQRDGQIVTLSWPATTSLTLQTTFDLTPPVSWQPVANPVVTSGSSFLYSVTNNATVPSQYFRLAP